VVRVHEAVLQSGRGGRADALHAPADYTSDGAGYLAACFALAGKIERARGIIEEMSSGDRGAAANVLFNVAHPVADAGDDRASGPMMELVLDYWPNNYMALYHAGMSEYSLGQTALAERHLRGFLAMYSENDGFTRRCPRRVGEDRRRRGSGSSERAHERRARTARAAVTAGSSYLASGSLFAGRFEIGRELGTGGVSVVYAARDGSVGQDVALKLLVPIAGDRESDTRAHAPRSACGAWPRAIRTSWRCTTSSRTVRTAPSSWSWWTARISTPVCDAVAPSHRTMLLGWAPRWPVRSGPRIAVVCCIVIVKPQNILLERDGRARLADFGSARMDGDTTITRTGAMVGTLAYMAPRPSPAGGAMRGRTCSR
jgi:hypothetical protein